MGKDLDNKTAAIKHNGNGSSRKLNSEAHVLFSTCNTQSSDRLRVTPHSSSTGSPSKQNSEVDVGVSAYNTQSTDLAESANSVVLEANNAKHVFVRVSSN